MNGNSNIGRECVIRLKNGMEFNGTVIDAAGRKVRRVRIQTPGKQQGRVLARAEFELVEFLT